jgi:hypothetical protein
MHVLRAVGALAALCLALILIALSAHLWPDKAVPVAFLDALIDPVRQVQVARLPLH